MSIPRSQAGFSWTSLSSGPWTPKKCFCLPTAVPQALAAQRSLNFVTHLPPSQPYSWFALLELCPRALPGTSFGANECFSSPHFPSSILSFREYLWNAYCQAGILEKQGGRGVKDSMRHTYLSQSGRRHTIPLLHLNRIIFFQKSLSKTAFLIYHSNGIDEFGDWGLNHVLACRIPFGDAGFLFMLLPSENMLCRGLW